MTQEREIMTERSIPWRINGVCQRSFLCSPEYADELALGHLLSQGILRAGRCAQAVVLADGSVDVHLSGDFSALPEDTLARLAACSPIPSALSVPRTKLRTLCSALLRREGAFGVHQLLLCSPQGSIVREDVGRHNAADKCAGYAYRANWDFSQCLLGCTGRISIEMLAKAAVMGVPVFFTAKYPSDLSIAWAERLHIALVSRAQREEAAVYGAAWRVRED